MESQLHDSFPSGRAPSIFGGSPCFALFTSARNPSTMIGMPSNFWIAFLSFAVQLLRTFPPALAGAARVLISAKATGFKLKGLSILFFRLFNSGSVELVFPSGGQNEGLSNCGVGL